MTTTSKVLYRGNPYAGGPVTLYTTPTSTTTVITNIVVTNAGSGDTTFSIWLNSVEFSYNASIAANTTITFDIKQVLPTGQTMQGLASNSDLKMHVSGVEIA